MRLKPLLEECKENGYKWLQGLNPMFPVIGSIINGENQTDGNFCKIKMGY
jgi:hypothetical protein